MAAFSMASMHLALPSTQQCNFIKLSGIKSNSSRISAKSSPQEPVISSFSGLRVSNPLKLAAESAASAFTSLVDNGAKWFAMRHGNRVSRLGRPADQRKALLRGLTTQLLRYGRIKTTQARAKAMRKFVEHMITLAKNGTLHDRRQALAFIYDKKLVHSLFEKVPERYGEREGGYTRIIRTMPRRGDNAPMAFIELVD